MAFLDNSDSGNEFEDQFETDEEEEELMEEEEEEAEEENDDDDEDIEDGVQILSAETIVKDMELTIIEVNTLLQLPPTSVRMLLNKFKWDKEKLIESYYSESNDENVKQHNEKQAVQQFGKSILCEICFEESESSDMTGLECGDLYCNNCWLEYLKTKIMDEGTSQTISCPTIGCSSLIADQDVFRLVKDQEVKLKYQLLITNSFVECNRFVKWCPAPGCSKAVKVTHPNARLVVCDCGNHFCFGCVSQWHEPVDCDMLKKWIKKCKDDSETANWISANTKDCPQCLTTIEKNGGCNHMSCKKESCKHEFCWICMGDWKLHKGSFYQCNRYVEDDKEKAVDTSRAALEKYLFYFNRFANHQQSLKLEKDLQTSTKEKMVEMQDQGIPWIEIQFLTKALDVLCKSRRTLMFTYVLAYYLKKDNQSEIFEDNQRDLESATERMSEYLEQEVTGENILELKQKIMDQLCYCEARRKVLLEHVEEGKELQFWIFN